MHSLLEGLNVVGQCRKYKLPLWSCPQFLFIVMGFLVIVSILATSKAAERFSGDPIVTILSVSSVTIIFFVIGHLVITSFERIANAQRAQAEFVSVVSHQLRTPLSAVRWQIGVMEERLKKKNYDIDAIVGTIKDENDRVIKLVSALLEVNRIEERRVGLHKENVSLWEHTEKILAGYRTFSQALKIELALEREKEIPYMVFADEGKLRWMIENLIDNAIRYSDKGGKITIRLSEKRKMYHWEIEDHGIGIPYEEQKNIFKKFYRAANAQQVQTEGSGLGLFVVKNFAEAMGGKLHFRSQEGVGTTFWFTLPIIKEDS